MQRTNQTTDQFALTDDQLAIQDMARKFTADMITPNAAKWDEEKHFPRDVVRAAGELGFGSIYISEEMGGIGLGRLESALIFEALSYGCPSTAAFISARNLSRRVGLRNCSKSLSASVVCFIRHAPRNPFLSL